MPLAYIQMSIGSSPILSILNLIESGSRYYNKWVIGLIPIAPIFYEFCGGCSSIGRAAGCEPEG